jgi:hypothetical protein
MRDMCADHEQAFVADPRHHAPACGAGVHRHVFADDVVAADDELRFLAGVFQILRLVADRREGKDPCVGAHRGAAGHDDMGMKHHAVLQRDLAPDVTVGADRNCLSESRARLDDDRPMNLRHSLDRPQASISIAA